MTKTAKSNKYGFTFTYYEDDSYIGQHMAVDQNEPAESALFNSIVKPDSVILDLGANIGYYTMIAGMKMQPGGLIIAVEPESENFALLTKNIEQNNLNDYVIAVKAAASNAPGTAKLYLCNTPDGKPLNRGDHKLNMPSRAEFEEVEVTTVDQLVFDYCNANDLPTIMKMDTQGAEHLILQGAKEFLAAEAPLVLITEFTPGAYSNDDEYFDLLRKEFEYLYIIDDATMSIVPVRDYISIKQYCVARGHTHANLYCVRYAEALGVPSGDTTITL